MLQFTVDCGPLCWQESATQRAEQGICYTMCRVKDTQGYRPWDGEMVTVMEISVPPITTHSATDPHLPQPLPAARRQCLVSRQNLPSWPANCSLSSDCLSRIILSCLHSHHRARQWQRHWLIVCITKSFQERPRCLITLQTTSWATSRTFA